jgi:hypothetical protein
MTQQAAELAAKSATKLFLKTALRKSLEKMAAEGVAKGLSEKMSESIATKVVEKTLMESAERQVSEALVEAAVETSLGPVGWILEIAQAISMVLDIADVENYNKMMTDASIEETVGNIESGVAKATIGQACTLVDTVVSGPPWNSASLGSRMDCMKECLKCKFRQWPPRKRPFKNMHNINDDPALSARLHAYMIDYFRWMPTDTTSITMTTQCRGYLPPPHLGNTGSPDYTNWVPRLYNSKGARVNVPDPTKNPDIKKYAFSTLQLWFMDTIMPFAFTQNYNLAIRMQQTKKSINVCILLMGAFVILFVLVLWGLLNASTAIALGK